MYMASRAPQFDFGENWANFSADALTPVRLAQARKDFATLTEGIPVARSHFLDIGFGQGLTLLAAATQGAIAVGCDINSKCAAVLNQNRRLFPDLRVEPRAVVGSILDPQTLVTLTSLAKANKGYDIVHSWGVLHHTGDMGQSIKNAASLVAPGGYLILALYNRHWSSSAWLAIKWLYVKSPRWLQRIFVGLFYPIIYIAKWIVTLKDPKRQERGMDFYYNVVDWVGGYPYEYASEEEVIALVNPCGFEILKVNKAIVPTGCNEFVFRRKT